MGVDGRFIYNTSIKKSSDQTRTRKWYLQRAVFGGRCGWPPGIGSPRCSLWPRHMWNRPSCRGLTEVALSGHNQARVPATMTGVQKCWMSLDLYPRWAGDQGTKGDNHITSCLWFPLRKDSGCMKLLKCFKFQVRSYGRQNKKWLLVSYA